MTSARIEGNRTWSWRSSGRRRTQQRAYRLCLGAGPLVVAVIGRLEELDFVPSIMRDAV